MTQARIFDNIKLYQETDNDKRYAIIRKTKHAARRNGLSPGRDRNTLRRAACLSGGIMTPADQLRKFEQMLDLCDRYGWPHLAELVYQQYIKLQIEASNA